MHVRFLAIIILDGETEHSIHLAFVLRVGAHFFPSDSENMWQQSYQSGNLGGDKFANPLQAFAGMAGWLFAGP